MEERDSPSRLVCGGFNKQGDLRLDLGTAEWVDLHSACQNLKAYREVLMRFSRIQQLLSHVGFATHYSLKAVFLKPAPMGGVVGRMYSPGERTGRSFQLPLFSSQVLLSMTSSSDYEISYLSFICECVLSCSVVSNYLRPHRLFCPWDFPGKKFPFPSPMGRGVFLTQGSNQVLLHWHADSLPPPHLGSQSEILVAQLCSTLWPHEL